MEELKVTGQENQTEKTMNTLGSLPPLPPTHPNEEISSGDIDKNGSIGFDQEGKLAKKKYLNILMGLGLVLLVAGIATGTYFVSRRVSSTALVAPTATESKPLAGDGDGCPAKPCAKGYICVKNAKGNGVCKKASPGVDPNLDCSETTDCSGTGGKPNDVIVCGTQVCNKTTEECCGNGCKLLSKGGCDTNDGGTTTDNKCSAIKPFSSEIKFKKAGVVQIFTKGLNGKLSIKPPTGDEIVVENISGLSMVKEITVQNAKDVYTITAYVDDKEAIGWIKNKSASKCGPESSKCGDDVDISELITLAEKTSTLDADNIVNGDGKKATVQCWGDAKTGDDTTDYDYNDFTIAVGYKDAIVGPTCNQVIVNYKNDSGVWTEITSPEEIPYRLSTGDAVKLEVIGASTSTKARFRATLNGADVFDTNNTDTTLSGWVEKTTATTITTGKLFSHEFTLPSAGSYSFFAEVQ